jgi:hypothetical protein
MPRAHRTASAADSASSRVAPGSDAGRDAHGRFTKGNPGGPGNPFARRTAAMRKALCDAVNEEDLRQIAEALKRKAKEGDVAAARLVLSYVVGRPEATVDPDTLDEEEMRQYLRQPELAARMPDVLQTIDAETCCDIVRVARPGMVEAMREQMAEAMITGRVPGTGEQICPPLEPSGRMRHEAPDDDSAPSPNGDNGDARQGGAGPGRAVRKHRKGRRGAGGHKGNGVSKGHNGRKTAAQRRSGGDGPNGRLGEKRNGRGGHRQETGETAAPEDGVSRRGVRGRPPGHRRRG